MERRQLLQWLQEEGLTRPRGLEPRMRLALRLKALGKEPHDVGLGASRWPKVVRKGRLPQGSSLQPGRLARDRLHAIGTAEL